MVIVRADPGQSCPASRGAPTWGRTRRIGGMGTTCAEAFRRGGHAGLTISDLPPGSLRHSVVHLERFAELFVHPWWMMSGECGRGQMVGRAKTTDLSR